MQSLISRERGIFSFFNYLFAIYVFCCLLRALHYNISRHCICKSNTFCYTCGHFTPKFKKRTTMAVINKACQLYDENPVIRTGHSRICCSRGVMNRRACLLNRTQPAVPVVWRETRDHTSDCYFCLTLKTHTLSNTQM
jgi:hypothetical protein